MRHHENPRLPATPSPGFEIAARRALFTSCIGMKYAFLARSPGMFKTKNTVWDRIHHLEGEGATYREVDMPHPDYALAAYYIIAISEASSNLARFDGMRYGLRTEDKD